MNDPIVDEVRRTRDAHAARFDYDLDAIFQDIKLQEKLSGRKFVSFVRPDPSMSETIQSHENSHSASHGSASHQVAPTSDCNALDSLERA